MIATGGMYSSDRALISGLFRTDGLEAAMGGSDLDEPHPLKPSPNPPEIDRWVQEWPRGSQAY